MMMMIHLMMWWIHPSSFICRIPASINGKPVLPSSKAASWSGLSYQGMSMQMGFLSISA